MNQKDEFLAQLLKHALGRLRFQNPAGNTVEGGKKDRGNDFGTLGQSFFGSGEHRGDGSMGRVPTALAMAAPSTSELTA